MSETLEQLIALGNEGAPQEWLDHLTGQGIGDGYEGITAEEVEKIIASGELIAEADQIIQATYETRFLQCNATNFTKGRGGNSVQWLVIHYTAGAKTADGAAEANCIYFGREANLGASAHYFVCDGYTIWQSVSESDTAWHAGNWAINQRSIGIEVCTAGAFTEAEIERLTWLVQHLMAKYGIAADHVIRHYDANGKHCPAHYVDAARWNELHARITTGSAAPQPAQPAPSKPAASSSTEKTGTGFGGRYRCTVNGLRVRTAPSLNSSVVASYNKGQTVVLDDWYKITDGWVWGRYTGAQSGQKRYVAVGKPTGGPAADDYLLKF
ncbi:N-acetylmuramoyl-L-alanine amidase [Adlercreutzia sp.]|uniref:N-acetylmuramoyl-L-alanine amidase n=1 Tax=Adlercreutzia sp. TaxID=1872387 RepID=UPI003AB8444A